MFSTSRTPIKKRKPSLFNSIFDQRDRKREKYSIPSLPLSTVSSVTTHSIPSIPIITNEWVSASKTRNYIMKDPLLDWLNIYGVKKGFVPDEKGPNYDKRLDFGKYIMGQGNAFEANIMAKLKTKFGASLVEVNPNSFTARMKDTLNLMKAGTPIIAQGMIFDTSLKVYGIPDLIVRSDYINKLVDTQAISDKVSGCRLDPAWHYRIVDIKFSTLKLKANFTTLLNQGSQKAYKAQLYIYNNCLAHIQGFNPTKSYILGRGWDATKSNTLYCSNNPFSKLGVISFEEDDVDICNETQQAVAWLRRVMSSGDSWYVLPRPSIPELYPNMGNDSSAGWDNVKYMLAKTLKEITLVWQAGVSARESAHSRKIYTWDDPKCSAEVLGISGPKMKPMVDQVLKANRGNDLIVPVKIKNNMYNWRECGKEFFIDFENVTSIFNLEDNSCNMIYMLGIGWVNNECLNSESSWNYKAIIANELDVKQEESIVREFLDTIGTLANIDISCPECKTSALISCNHYGCQQCSWQFCPLIGWWDGQAQCKCTDITNLPELPIKLYHYSHAESSMMTKALERIKFDDSSKDKRLLAIKSRIQFCDLLKLIKEEPVIIKGAMDFSLKSIVSALKEQGKINVSYDLCKVKSGCDGLLAAIVAAAQSEVPFRDHELIKAATDYNNVDCKSLYEILTFLRANH